MDTSTLVPGERYRIDYERTRKTGPVKGAFEGRFVYGKGTGRDVRLSFDEIVENGVSRTAARIWSDDVLAITAI